MQASTIAGSISAPVPSDLIRNAVDEALKDTSDSVTKLVSSSPDPTWTAILAGQLRTWSAAGGGILATYSQTVSGQDWQLLAGLIVMGTPAVFSWLSKKWAAIRSHDGNKASASASAIATVQAGSAVAVPVKPA